jgi:hypothetical protein
LKKASKNKEQKQRAKTKSKNKEQKQRAKSVQINFNKTALNYSLCFCTRETGNCFLFFAHFFKKCFVLFRFFAHFFT